MKTLRFSITLLLFCLLPSTAFADLTVVASLPSLGALAREVGGPHVTVSVLASASEDPHYVSPRPDFVLRANRADLLIYNGMELEIGWLPPVQKNARNPRITDGARGALDASTFITPLEVPTGKIDRAQGDIHAQGNPHYLYCLPNAIAVARGIASRMIELDPGNATDYQKQLEQFVRWAEDENKYWTGRFAALPPENRRIISYHDSMIYLTRWLGLEQVGTIEPLPGVAPGPAHVTALASRLKVSPVSYILQENYQPRSTSEKIGKLTGAKIVIVDPGPAPQESFLDYVHRTFASFF